MSTTEIRSGAASGTVSAIDAINVVTEAPPNDAAPRVGGVIAARRLTGPDRRCAPPGPDPKARP